MLLCETHILVDQVLSFRICLILESGHHVRIWNRLVCFRSRKTPDIGCKNMFLPLPTGAQW